MVDTDTNGVKSYEVECIIAQRGPPRSRQLLVRWAGYAAPEHEEWKTRRELLRSAPEAVAEFDALQQPDTALAQLTVGQDVTVTGTPPEPRLVGIELNPVPCHCHGRRPAAEQAVACNTARCSCRAQGNQCTAACGCGASGNGAATTRCYNCPTAQHWPLADIRLHRLQRELAISPLMGGAGATPRMATWIPRDAYTRRPEAAPEAPPAPRLVGIELNPGPCNCGGTVTTAVSCCRTRRCPYVVAGIACTAANRLNHVCPLNRTSGLYRRQRRKLLARWWWNRPWARRGR